MSYVLVLLLPPPRHENSPEPEAKVNKEINVDDRRNREAVMA